MKHRGSNVNDTRQLRETRHARPADRLDAFYVALFSGECRGAMGIAAGVARTGQRSAGGGVPRVQASLHSIWGGTLQGMRTGAPQPLPSEEDRVLRTFEVLRF